MPLGPVARFLRFGAVGASGVLVNALFLVLFVEGFSWPVLAASLLSIELSTLSNWFLNRHWTWKDRDDTALHSLAKYHGVAVVGMAIQWLVLAVALTTTDMHYLAGTVLGVGAATAWNFAGSHFFSFRDASAKPMPRWALYATSAFAQLVLAAVFAHPWDTFVFQRSVEDLLLRGMTPYEVAEAAPSYTYWGGALPALPMWYAYPPIPLALMSASYFPSALGWVPWGWAGRVLIRLPFIAATLGAAVVARRLVLTAPGANAATPQRADKAERLMLLNPMFIVIAAIWGQFEALILLLLMLSVAAMRQAHWGRSGAWWALAVCVKIFPLYLVPLLAVHLHRTGGRRAVLRFAGVAAAIGAAINVPFLLLSPRGYLQQVVFMHGARAPARLAPLAYINKLLTLLSNAWPQHMPEPSVWAAWLGAVSLVLVTAVLLALAAASRRKPATEGRLLEWMALSLLGGLLATKVLNEQYLILPLGLLLVARAHPQRTLAPGIGRFVAVGSWAVVATGLLAGLNILFAVPAPLAKAVFGALAPETLGRLAAALSLTSSQLKSILAWATSLFILAPCLYAFHRLARPIADGLLVLERAAMGLMRRGVHHSTRPAAVAGAILLLCTAPLGVALAGGLNSHAASQPLADGERWALAELRTSWYNPGNDVERAEGTWQGVTTQPEAGFYNLNAHKAETDVALVQRAGFDGIVIQVHPYYGGAAGTLRRVAEAEGLPYALGIDLAEQPGTLSIEAATARHVRTTLQSPTLDYWQGRHHILAPDGLGKVVFLSGVAEVQPGFTAGERRFVVDAWLATAPDAADAALLQASAAPRSVGDLRADDAVGELWRAAYASGLSAWWGMALDTGTDLAFLTDAPLPAGTPAWLGTRSAAEPKALEAPAPVRFTTLHGILAPDTVRPGWEKARWTEADGVIVPWNDYRQDSAVEPTREHGRATLEETARQIAVFKAPRVQPAEQPDPVASVVRDVADVLPRSPVTHGSRASA
ncbi:MAG: GtrA family protein [Candidatus Thermoplasmatota archaeon]